MYKPGLAKVNLQLNFVLRPGCIHVAYVAVLIACATALSLLFWGQSAAYVVDSRRFLDANFLSK